MPVWLCGLLLGLLLPMGSTRAQVVAASPAPKIIPALGAPLVDLDGPWQFHLGDDARWAQPNFDDSGWRRITTDKGWDLQGVHQDGGFAWYRRHIQLSDATHDRPLSMSSLTLKGSYQVFWNGTSIGTCGSFAPRPQVRLCYSPLVLPVGASRDGVLAIRVWTMASFGTLRPGSQGLVTVPQLGLTTPVQDASSLGLYRWERLKLTSDLLTGLYFVVVLVVLVIWWVNGKDQLYLWLAIYLFCRVLGGVLYDCMDLGVISWNSEQLLIGGFGYVFLSGALWFLLVGFLLDNEATWRRVTWWMAGAYLTLQCSQSLPIQFLQFWSAKVGAMYRFAWCGTTLLPAYAFVLIAAGLRRRADAARWAIALSATLVTLWPILYNAYQLAQQWHRGAWIRRSLFSLLGSKVTLANLSEILLLLALGYAATQQLLASRRQRTETALELRSAAEVQHLLVPDQIPAIPGLAIDSVYKPAREVGGDFFQVLPAGEGRALVVIGDVSGKGMPAAMTVSMLVGALRTLVDYTVSPGEVLRGLNDRIAGRSDGFTTCLALLVHPNGDLCAANAGHIPPFVNGRELPLPNGLPLGLLPGITYDESAWHLAPDEQLTLLTDGVVEARNRHGNLFGFERAATLATDPAKTIAQAGEAFGQEDDITVVTLHRTPA